MDINVRDLIRLLTKEPTGTHLLTRYQDSNICTVLTKRGIHWVENHSGFTWGASELARTLCEGKYIWALM